MPRKPRVQYEGAIYHVMCRGNRQEAIFRDNKDCEMFLDTLGETCQRTGWKVHAFVLMGNHYHLLLETPEANLVTGMKWFQGTYTQRFNSRHKVWGHLFQGRYKALFVDPEGDYFSTVASYIHLNPARANCFDLEQGKLSDYGWSSFVGYLRPRKRPEWLCVDRVLGCLGYEDTINGRTNYRNYMKKRMLEIIHSDNPKKADAAWAEIRRGWVLGGDEFRNKMKEAVENVLKGKQRDSFSGELIKQHDEQEALRLLKEGLVKLGLSEDDLISLKKSDDRKKALAWLIRRNTSVKNSFISEQLKTGAVSHVSNLVRLVEKAEKGSLLWEMRESLKSED